MSVGSEARTPAQPGLNLSCIEGAKVRETCGKRSLRAQEVQNASIVGVAAALNLTVWKGLGSGKGGGRGGCGGWLVAAARNSSSHQYDSNDPKINPGGVYHAEL